jgi:acyl-CoA thioesterase-1
MWTSLRLIALVAVLVPACASPDAPRLDGDGQVPAEAAAATRTPAEQTSVTRRPRIVFLGDSLTAGLGLPREQAVPALIQARLDAAGYQYEVVNAGVSGDTSAGGLSRLDWSLDGDVRVLVIELGANDGLRGNPVDGMKRNLDEIIRRAKQRGIRVLLTGMEAPPNFGHAYTTEFRSVFAELARRHDVAFMPFFLDGVAGIPSLNGPDGIHPNRDGARIIERSLWHSLEPLLEKQG